MTILKFIGNGYVAELYVLTTLLALSDIFVDGKYGPVSFRNVPFTAKTTALSTSNTTRCDSKCRNYNSCVFLYGSGTGNQYTTPASQKKAVSSLNFCSASLKGCCSKTPSLGFGDSGSVVCEDNDSLLIVQVKEHSRLLQQCGLELISSCSSSNHVLLGQSLEHPCSTIFNPVTTRTQAQRGRIFKNPYCAVCNGIPLESVIAPLGLPVLPKRKLTKGIKLANTKENMPAAFSILLNFGLDGQERMMYSSENDEKMKWYQESCGKERIYDPFSGTCRKLHCSSQFSLVNYSCVRSTNGTDNDNRTQKAPPIYDTASEYVQLKLSLQASLPELVVYSTNKSCVSMEQEIRDTLMQMYKISADRIQNVTVDMDIATMLFIVTRTPDFFEGKSVNHTSLEDLNLLLLWNQLVDEKLNLTVRLRLYEAKEHQNTEPSPDKMVSHMVSLISSPRGFLLTMDGFSSRVIAINQKIPVVQEWCGPKDKGIRLEYWNEEFHLVLNESYKLSTGIKEVYINHTGRSYRPSEFIANILFQGYDDRQEVNISGFVIVCERPRLNDSCERVSLEEGSYKLLPDLSISYNGNTSDIQGFDLNNYEPDENGSMLFCYDKNQLEQWKYGVMWKYLDNSMSYDYAQALLSTTLLCISVIALGFVIFTYVVFRELRTLPGCNTLNLAITVFLSHLLFLLSQRQVVTGVMCKATGISLHFYILSSFFWMNVIAFDLYKTFGQNNGIVFSRSKRTLLPRYMLYGYGIPVLLVTLSGIQDTYPNDLRPLYGVKNYCWIGNSLAALVFFAIPLAVIILINFVFYVLTICSISAIHRKIQASCDNPAGYKDVKLYTKMAAVMGFTWVFGFLVVYVREFSHVAAIVFTYLFIVLNTSQGVLIFFAFVFNKRVYGLTRKFFGRIQNAVSKPARNFKDSVSKRWSRKVFNGVSKTYSTDTAISVLPY